MLHSNLVYKFKRNICNDIYYGNTKHHFKFRACEHFGITPLIRKKIKSPKESGKLLNGKLLKKHFLG